jgi:hypothetical protein
VTDPDPQKLFDAKIRAAERAHDDEAAFHRYVNEAAIKAGETVIKTAILINGGACVAILAFLGSLASQGRIGSAQLSDVAGALASFAFGVAVGALAAGAAYATNYLIAQLSASRAREWEAPFIRDGQKSKRRRHIAWCFHVLAVFFGAGSVLAFVIGIVQVRQSIGHLNPTAQSAVVPATTPVAATPKTGKD